MLQRCYNNKNPLYSDYGGRGIVVSSDWNKCPAAFIEWGLNNGWERGLDLDRMNNDAGYSPDNCRFVTHRQNVLNTRRQKDRELPNGVFKQKNRFVAHINLGSFRTKEEAHLAYLNAVEKLNL
jgi:hypothetical protein